MNLYAILVVVILLLVWCGVGNARRHEDYLYGCWSAEDNDFTDSAEIDSAMIFFGKADRGIINTTRLGYVVLTPDMYNGGLSLSYRTEWVGSINGHKHTIRATVTFDEEPIWDPEVTITINMLKGTMKIYNGDTVFMRLNKQHDITNTAALLEE
jgi:hypothetical protein